MKKKIMLITPPYHSGVLESAGTWLNLGFVYIAGSLRKAGYDVEIYDAMSYYHDYPDIQCKIETANPDVVASTAITASINDALKTLKLVKDINPTIITVLGGIHPTFCWKEILMKHHDFVDYIIRGEGELTFPELLQCYFSKDDIFKVKGIAYWTEKGAVITPNREYIQDLDSLSSAWDLIDWKIYSYRPKEGSTLAIVSSSRGCNQQCSFCSQQLFWNRSWRARTPENFVAELEHLHEAYSVNVVMIPDENPTFDRVRWEKILDLLIERKLDIEILMETRVEDIIRDRDTLWKYKKAGIEHIYVGVESISQKMLDRFKKDIKIEESKLALELINNEDIISETSFVLGMPEDTKESINTTVELAKHYNPDMAFFLAIAPWPYSDIYKELEPYIAIKDYSKYNLIEPVIQPSNMTLEEVQQELQSATKRFYMNKFSKLEEMSSFKREYMLAVAKLLMEHSCIADQMKEVSIGIPEKCREFIRR